MQEVPAVVFVAAVVMTPVPLKINTSAPGRGQSRILTEDGMKAGKKENSDA